MKARTFLGEATRKHFHFFRTLSVSSSRKELAGSPRLLSLAFLFSVNAIDFRTKNETAIAGAISRRRFRNRPPDYSLWKCI